MAEAITAPLSCDPEVWLRWSNAERWRWLWDRVEQQENKTPRLGAVDRWRLAMRDHWWVVLSYEHLVPCMFARYAVHDTPDQAEALATVEFVAKSIKADLTRRVDLDTELSQVWTISPTGTPPAETDVRLIVCRHE
ncbi:hypothetical protein ACJH6J_30330 [Mycobacterium sp. SMC-18]|uniref:hypothetical protein n=1 Tax=Mycobacteriaceae TaxID=1762 RepID=UPI001BB437E4|nr:MULTISPECIES: hypothetical protein [unclassified Mycolicibacterium]BCI83579.1 hypothetical protein MTY66_52040 [Mycolicibacterium sp. TY66]BCJ78779.1 hypothetical protein MTY81_01520 [Mycolicibacterium sp. TY81]